jgi:hypothetical protein
MRIFLCGKAEECRRWKLFQCKPDGQEVKWLLANGRKGDSWLGVTKLLLPQAKARLTRGKRAAEITFFVY